jgi:hypothetical protein
VRRIRVRHPWRSASRVCSSKLLCQRRGRRCHYFVGAFQAECHCRLYSRAADNKYHLATLLRSSRERSAGVKCSKYSCGPRKNCAIAAVAGLCVSCGAGVCALLFVRARLSGFAGRQCWCIVSSFVCVAQVRHSCVVFCCRLGRFCPFRGRCLNARNERCEGDTSEGCSEVCASL